MLTREHRLYQADFLLRKYGFSAAEIPSDKRGFLSLEQDPKEAWARTHPERFPVNLNRAGKWDLLRVPGLGPVTVSRILDMRREGRRIRDLSQLGTKGKRLARALDFVCFG
jgi:predicted DNA-binding helix-hairpin-helix protein